mmetsp:Transcript_58764/g.91353  ORF Transcript_58764/g.91353 Transcript_58764/m.91353 type:complete len:582 (-) Transcript_58764:82-1827(-)
MRSNLASSPLQMQVSASNSSGVDFALSPASSCNAPSTPGNTPSNAQRQRSSHASTRQASQCVHGPPVSVKSPSDDASQQPKLSKFLDASVQPPNGTLVAQVQPQVDASTPQVARYTPARIRSRSVGPITPPSTFSPMGHLGDNVLQMAVSGIEEAMADQMQKLSVALESALADITSRIDSERQSRERQIHDVHRLFEEYKPKSHDVSSPAAVSSTSESTLHAEVQAGISAIVAQKAEAVSMIESVLKDGLAKQQELQCPSSVAPDALQRTLEGKFQHIMEMQIQKLTSVLSSAVEKRFADVTGKLQLVELKWAESIEKERMERKDACAQQVQELRQILDVQLLSKQTPRNAQLPPEMTPQEPTREFEGAMAMLELKRDLQKVEKHVQTHLQEAQLCRRLLEENRKASDAAVLELRSSLHASRRDVEALQAQGVGEGRLLEKVQCKVRDCVAELAKSLGDFQEKWSREAADTRNFTMNEVNAIRTEVQALGGELDTVQTTVVHRVGEVCAATLREWKDHRCKDVGRLEENLHAVQEAMAKYCNELKACTRQLSAEVDTERTDRCKSVNEIRLQLVQLTAGKK